MTNNTERPKYDSRHLNLLDDYTEGALKKDISKMIFQNTEGTVIGEASGSLELDANGWLRINVVPVEEISYEYKDNEEIIVTGTFEDGLRFEKISVTYDKPVFGERKLYFSPDIPGDYLHRIDSITITSDGLDGIESRLISTTLMNHVTESNNVHNAKEVNYSFYNNFPTPYGYFVVDGCDYEIRSKKNIFIYTASPKYSGEEQIRFDHALILAISFASGKKIRIQAYTETGKINKTTLYRRIGYETDTFCPPLRLHIAGNQGYEMIECLQKFIFSNNNKSLEAALELYLLSPIPLEAGIRTLLVAALIEGLIPILTELPGNREFKDARDKFLTYFKSTKIDGIPDKLYSHFINLLRSAQPSTLRDRITFLKDVFKIPISEKEMQSFIRARNDLAHGDFFHPYQAEENQIEMMHDNLGAVTNIFNKIILCASGYKGDYSEYSRDNKYRWDIKNITKEQNRYL